MDEREYKCPFMVGAIDPCLSECPAQDTVVEICHLDKRRSKFIKGGNEPLESIFSDYFLREFIEPEDELYGKALEGCCRLSWFDKKIKIPFNNFCIRWK
jgi:hypothetical protein